MTRRTITTFRLATLGLAGVLALSGCETLSGGGYPARGSYVGGGYDFSYTAEQDGVLHVFRHSSREQIGSYSLKKGQTKQMDQPDLVRAMYGGRRIARESDEPILVDLHFEPTGRAALTPPPYQPSDSAVRSQPGAAPGTLQTDR